MRLDLVAFATRAALATTFLVAALAKLRSPETVRAHLSAAGLRPPIVVGTYWCVIAAEVVAAVSIAVLPGPGGLWLAVVVLSAFATWLALGLSRTAHTPCGCFGPSTRPPSAVDVVRNLALIGVAAVALTRVPEWRSLALFSHAALPLALCTTGVTLALTAAITFKSRPDRAPNDQLAPGPHDNVSELVLETTAGLYISVADLVASGGHSDLLLVFTLPACTLCAGVLTTLATLVPTRGGPQVSVVVVGSLEEAKYVAERYRLTSVLAGSEATMIALLGRVGAPSSVRIDGTGTVVEAGGGVDAVMAAIERGHDVDTYGRAQGEVAHAT